MEYIEPNSERYLSLEDLPNEHWKDIKGYEGLYQISDYGRVKSLERFSDKTHHYLTKILSPGKDRNGYYKVHLFKNKKSKNMPIHRLVGDAFLSNPENKPIYNHLKIVTKDYCNNCVDNLEPATISENLKYAYKNGTKKPNINMKGKIGIKSPFSKKVAQYNKEYELVKIWDCFNDIERELGFLHGNIVSCCKGRYKQAYGYIWKYTKEENIYGMEIQ